MPIRTDKRGAYYNAASIPHAAHKKIQGRVQQIIIAFAVMVLPMLVLSGVLLGLIFCYRAPPNPYVSDDLGREKSREQDYLGAYLVRFSAPKLVLVASWSSTISPILIGFAVTLASYPTAKNLLTTADVWDTAQLPTPFQLSLIINTISGRSFSSIWNWSTYTFGWRSKRQGRVKALKGLMITLFMGLILSTLVLVTDTWLHFSTKAVIFIKVGANPDPSGLGFGITFKCSDQAPNDKEGCRICNLNSGYLEEGNEALKIFDNVSDTISVPVHTSALEQYPYVANPQMSRLSSLDYTAETFAIQSQCKPVTSQCTNRSMQDGNYIDYTCPFAMEGRFDTRDLGANAGVIGLTFFTNATGSQSTYDSRSDSFERQHRRGASALECSGLGRGYLRVKGR